MKIELTVTKEFEVEFLQVDAGVRYWYDGTINGESLEDGSTTPCKEGERWKPLINLETGQIVNWTKGIKADIHYKVCDDGLYTLVDKDKQKIKEIEGYVPNIMCPKGTGYGDYIIMDINEDGFIQGWSRDLSEFIEED